MWGLQEEAGGAARDWQPHAIDRGVTLGATMLQLQHTSIIQPQAVKLARGALTWVHPLKLTTTNNAFFQHAGCQAGARGG